MNAYEHLKNLWLAFALVNALLISSSTTALTANVNSLEASNVSSVAALSKHAVYGVLWGICLMCNVWALILSMTGLGLVLNERTNDAVIEKFGNRFLGGPKGRNESRKYCMTMLPSVFTSVGAILFAIASSATACYKYGQVACLVTVVPERVYDCRRHWNVCGCFSWVFLMPPPSPVLLDCLAFFVNRERFDEVDSINARHHVQTKKFRIGVRSAEYHRAHIVLASFVTQQIAVRFEAVS